ncbi:lipid kinase YegS [Shimwellia pseudoproteus]|uniref:lipid kinase YegS n=1 Tax=Shimwellia pseudoproteus TaxID=570012 RepID=UPI0018EE0742|nr:lipid kinase YegS [Shimwellia pseudoproteus]MBJ3816969.1 lipid kinase YegS [Shimwellia pseudoproteus]
MAVFIVLNGKSAGNDALRDAVNALRQNGVDIQVRVTWEHGDARRIISEAIAAQAGTVIAAGGDGTINEVATVLASLDKSSRPALGIIPLGTANDFATSVGIPQDIDKALLLAIGAHSVPVDLVKVNDSACFINMASGGFGTKITTETPEKLKSALGGISYFIHGLLRIDTLKPDRCRIRGENFQWAGEALVIGIGNGRQAGGGQQLCPVAEINDGLLDVRIFTGEELIPALLSAITRQEESPNIIDARSAWFEVDADTEMTFNLDGEPLTGTHFRLEVEPGAIECRLPPGCPLLR